MNRPGRSVRLLLLVAALAAGCGGPAADAVPLQVFAAASLTAPFQAVAKAFEAAHPGCRVELNLAGSQQLVAQIEAGADADVYASADVVWMQRLKAKSRLWTEPRMFAANKLAIAVGKGNPQAITGLADLARPGLKVLLCAPDVPAGRYARTALQQAKVEVVPVSEETSVKAVVAKLLLGEADAGIVYATDITATAGKLAAVELPAAVAAAITAHYPIAVVNSGKHHDLAKQFTVFVGSPPGQEILRAHGFLPP